MTRRLRLLIAVVVTIRAVVYGCGGWVVATEVQPLPWGISPIFLVVFCVGVSLLSSWMIISDVQRTRKRRTGDPK